MAKGKKTGKDHKGRKHGDHDEDEQKAGPRLPVLRVDDCYQDWLHGSFDLEVPVAQFLEESVGEHRPKGGLAYVIYDPASGQAFVDDFVSRLSTLYPSTVGRVFVEDVHARERRGRLLTCDQGLHSLFNLYDSDQDGYLDVCEWRHMSMDLAAWARVGPVTAVKQTHELIHALFGGDSSITFHDFEKKFLRVEKALGVKRQDLNFLFDEWLTTRSPPQRAQATLVIVAATSVAALTSPVCWEDLEYFENRSKHKAMANPDVMWAIFQHKRAAPELLPLLQSAPAFLRELVGATGIPRPASAPWKSKQNGVAEPLAECMVYEWVPALGDVMLHTFIRSYHNCLDITDHAQPEYYGHTHALRPVEPAAKEAKVHLLVAFDRRKRGLLLSWRIVRSLRRFCSQHMPWVTVDTFSHILLEFRLRCIPPGSRVCVVLVTTPGCLSALDIGMDLQDAYRCGVHSVCMYDTAAKMWGEFCSAPSLDRALIAPLFTIPYTDSYGVGPSCMNILTRLRKDPITTDDEPTKKKGPVGEEPAASQYMLLRDHSLGGDWGENFRDLLMDVKPAVVICDFYAELDADNLADMAAHTKVLCVLASEGNLAGAVGAMKRAHDHGVKLALLQHSREVFDCSKLEGRAASLFHQCVFIPVVRDNLVAAKALVTYRENQKLELDEVKGLVAMVAESVLEATDNVPETLPATLSLFANALCTGSAPWYARELVGSTFLKTLIEQTKRSANVVCAQQLLRVLRGLYNDEELGEKVRSTPGLLDSLMALRRIHQFHPYLPTSLQDFMHKLRHSREEVPQHIKWLAAHKFEDHFDTCSRQRTLATESVQMLCDLDRSLTQYRIQHGQVSEEADEAKKLRDEHLHRLQGVATELEKMSQELSVMVAPMEERIAQVQKSTRNEISKYGTLKTDLSNLARQKQMPSGIGELLKLFAWLFAGIEADVMDVTDSTTLAPKDTSWTGLRRMISEPVRFISAFVRLCADYRFVPPASIEHCRALSSGEPKNSTFLDIKLLWGMVLALLDAAEMTVEVGAVQCALLEVQEAHAEVLSDLSAFK